MVTPTQPISVQHFDALYSINCLKEARNSFVGRAQTGFQFSRETQKLKQTNKNGVALSSGFNILRRSLKAACRQG